MSDPIADLEPFLKALASETRQKILFKVLVDGKELTVGQIAEASSLSQSTASEHLALLKRGGLVESRREGKEVYYRTDRRRILQTVGHLTEQLCRCCPPE